MLETCLVFQPQFPHTKLNVVDTAIWILQKKKSHPPSLPHHHIKEWISKGTILDTYNSSTESIFFYCYMALRAGVGDFGHITSPPNLDTSQVLPTWTHHKSPLTKNQTNEHQKRNHT